MVSDTLEVEVRRLQEQTEQQRLELLRTDLDLCQTLVRLAESKIGLGKYTHAAPTLDRAGQGYVAMQRILGQRQGWDEKATNEIAESLAVLRRNINRVQQLAKAPNGI